jgi:hypothetical protein
MFVCMNEAICYGIVSHTSLLVNEQIRETSAISAEMAKASGVPYIRSPLPSTINPIRSERFFPSAAIIFERQFSMFRPWNWFLLLLAHHVKPSGMPSLAFGS